MTTINNNTITNNSSNSNISYQPDKFNVVAGSTPFLKSKESGKIFKEGTREERKFYEQLATKDNQSELIELIPRYFGKLQDQQKDYIILEDLTSGYRKPCIMDIKLGLSHHDVPLDRVLKPPQTPLKPQQQSNNTLEYIRNELEQLLGVNGVESEFYKKWTFSKYITTPLLGFCICGLQKYNPITKQYEKSTKEQGRVLTVETVRDELYHFFSLDHNESDHGIVRQIQERLLQFKNYFENNPDYRFRSSSILFIYEGDRDISTTIKKCDIRLIDFTHTKEYPDYIRPFTSLLSTETSNYPFFPIDGGYLFGITKILEILKDFIPTPILSSPPL
ncbi:hypothetical protein DLAC_02812 [Tieghemostelium lacteum]|uniref:Kinase n=1 Tax=Tieghemostelium lacteum TaxID=361077 RepID=A0A152A3I3_TIELA|nr:hypothetical protein DLAC_02812 [Tieghemostelium lacteum]|eukprot:KYR00769.1 hypothetical protein DLAC_02812 [Tieghemostelium lacteum]